MKITFRQRFDLLALVAAVLFCADAAVAEITLVATASRATSDVTIDAAPVAIFFDATGTTCESEDGCLDANWNAFRVLDYRWTFGDDSTAVWQYSGQPKDVAIGPIAMHVYENPGTYTVTLTVTSSVVPVTRSWTKTSSSLPFRSGSIPPSPSMSTMLVASDWKAI